MIVPEQFNLCGPISPTPRGNFPQHRFADVFDDVIEDVLARGVVGDEADGCRVRGTVDG